MGIMTPYKGIRVLTRAGQGLLGSDVELEELLCRVLGQAISDGYCLAVRDDIIIGGNTVDQAITNYERVLMQLNNNNLKLSPNKVRLFPADTEIYGYRVKDGCIEPSEHRVTSIGKTKIESLTSVKSVNSWKGLYKTLIGHLPGLAMVMSPFDSATGGKSSRETFTWTPALTAAFNQAMSHLDKVNKTYLPAPHEQLLLLPDTMSVPPCTGWVMYTKRDDKLLPVTYCSAKLKDYMVKWFPCEKEGVGTVLAIEQCAHWICESDHPTMVGPDSSAVVDAAELIRKGKHSSNPRLQSLLSSVNRRNVRFFHNSAKSGKHIVPDTLSRLKDTRCRSKDCAVERFLDDIPIKLEAMSITLLSLVLEDDLSPAIIAATSAELADLLTVRSGPIPLGSRATWIEIQKSDEDCRAIFKQKSSGDVPRKKNTNPVQNKIFKEAIIHQGLLVVREFDDKKMREVDKVVVPPTYLDSILTVVHIKLNHPTQYQLRQVYERYFFSPRLETALDNLYSSCYICFSLQKFPKELETFSPSLFPDHPGSHMNIDVLKRSGQLIVVNIDLFSGFVTACFTDSEKSSDLSTAIIQVITPVRHSDTVLVRVDKAPALQSLAKDPSSDLTKLGINLDIPLDDNKNSNCRVDKAIYELEIELKKLSPSGEPLTTSELAKAVTILNNLIRNRGLSSSEIHFSRDSHDHQNLHLDDDHLQSEQKTKRLQNHDSSSRSKAPGGKAQVVPSLEKGEIVYIKSHGDKHHSRDPHIVIQDSQDSSVLRKALHSSPQDDRPPSLSSKDRTVANKFIFKPKASFQSQLTPIPESPADDDTNEAEAREEVVVEKEITWHPISRDDEEDIMPVCLLPNTDTSDSDTLETEFDRASEFDDEEETNSSTQDSSHDDLLDVSDILPPHGMDDDDNGLARLFDEGDDDNGLVRLFEGDADDGQVRLFDAGEGLYEDEALDQSRPLKKNDSVAFFNGKLGKWIRIKIISNPVRRKGWKYWHNYALADGEQGGMFFFPDLRWTILNEGHSDDGREDTEDQSEDNGGQDNELDAQEIDDQIDEQEDNEIDEQEDNQIDEQEDNQTDESESDHDEIGLIQQVDGLDIPESATPDTSPDQVLGARPKAPVRFTTCLYDDSSDDDENLLNNAALETSLDWDAYGTELEASPERAPIDLDRVANLDEILPLTSTPIPSEQRRQRVSAPRQLLPREHDGGKPGFIARLNPFRKKPT